MPIKKYVRSNGVSKTRSDLAGSDEVDKPPSSFHVTNWDIIGLLYSITIHIIDVALDVYLAYHYIRDSQYIYFILTVSFMLIPAVIITVISMRMYCVDNDASQASRIAVQRIFLCILVLALQLTNVLRYCDSLNFALRSRRAEKQKDRYLQEHYYRKMLSVDADVALLRVFECYLESAPQQILQITILLVDFRNGTNLHLMQQSLSITSSFISMAWCMAAYHRSIRFDQDAKNNISWTGSGVQFLWHLFVTISRILSIAVVASLYPFWTSLAVGFHWMFMLFWLAMVDTTAFFGTSILEIFFPAIVALVYIFNYISIKEGRTRRNYLLYYPLCLIENIIAVTIWALYTRKSQKKSWYYFPLIASPFITFLLGMIFLLVYYKFFHPKKFDLVDRRLNMIESMGINKTVEDDPKTNGENAKTDLVANNLSVSEHSPTLVRSCTPEIQVQS